MGIIESGLIVSTVGAVLLAVLFAYEERQGTRIAARFRQYADYLALKAVRGVHAGVQYVTVHVVRQVGHYLFHVVLKGALAFMKRAERALTNVMRTNKTLARTAERERATRNKLEEIALHKMETALTEKERAKTKERALRGDTHRR
jgi:hypothetical protein